MRSPAAAIAWEFRRRHRWGLTALAAYFTILAAIKLLILVSAARVHFADTETFAFLVIVPTTCTFIYFLAVFSFGLDGDLAGRQSMYPPRMFTLPLTNDALVAWPMLYGAAAMAVLWFATRVLAVWPPGVDVPVTWPALLAASLLAWTQALTWLPYALPGLRVIVTVLWLASIDAVILLALYCKASEAVMLAILSPHIPLAYLVARSAVARGRRGDVPDWRWMLVRRRDAREREHFASAARAQQWFEWRQHGRTLPSLVAMLLPFELALLFVFRETPPIVIETLVLVLLTPPIMAAFVAAASNSYGVTPFITTRPLDDVSLIAAKLKVTIWSTVAAWLLVIVAVPVALRFSGTAPYVIERAHAAVQVLGVPRAVALALFGFIALTASTWKRLVQSLYIGMTGREWLVKAAVFGALSFLAIVAPVAHWIFTHTRVMAAMWNGFPWIAAGLVCVKIAAAAFVAVRLYDRRLLSDRTLLVGATSWTVAVFVLYGVLEWIFPEMLIRHYVLALIAILEVPLARLGAAPLALAWNRHR